jgi:hypothetical protein
VRGTAASWFNPAWVAFGFGAVVTMILSVLRQMFAGFWFHPIGFVLGSSNFMDYVFGSALTAWVIRGIALRLGGAATVRNKLQPFFIGVFLGEALGYLLLGVHGAYLRSVGIELLYPILTP